MAGNLKLVQVDCNGPGLTRVRRGRGFSYHDGDGRLVDNPEVTARIRALAIPPAWTDVWICPGTNGHIQAAGTDAAGRRQYLYHDEWHLQASRRKFDEMLVFAARLPRFRLTINAHIRAPGFPRRRALGLAARFLDRTMMRIGTEVYAEENGTYGLATLMRDSVEVRGERIAFDYVAKGGIRQTGEIRDRATAKAVRELLERDDPSPELLAFRGGVGRGWVDVTSAAINAYIKSHAGEEASAKTFRSWGATVLAARELADPECTPPRVCERVAESLGNTPTVTRDSYIDPRVFGAAENGLRLAPRFARLDPGLTRNRNAIDRAVVQLIESASAG